MTSGSQRAVTAQQNIEFTKISQEPFGKATAELAAGHSPRASVSRKRTCAADLRVRRPSHGCPPAQNSKARKKESTGHRLNRHCAVRQAIIELIDDNVPAALLPCDSASRASTVGIVWGDDKSDRGVDFAPDHRGVPVGQCTSLSYSGPGHCVWPGLRAAVARHGHSGQADRAPIAVAEPVRRETDRHDPPGMSRPHDRVREAHLRRILDKYAAYYDESRIHGSLDKDAPFHRAIEHLGVITSRPVLGGLHHQYCRI
jgi:hypothetical protein